MFQSFLYFLEIRNIVAIDLLMIYQLLISEVVLITYTKVVSERNIAFY